MSAQLNEVPHFIPACTIAVAEGDGIGPEITRATLDILRAADPTLQFQEVTVGLKAYESGLLSGVGEDTWQALAKHKVMLKGPITTPQGGGYKSVNVTLRKTLGLYANLRPCVSYHPFVSSMHTKMDVVIVRENEEDTYAGIEHRQSDEVYQCLKLITRPGCERIIRYAFEYARSHSRKKVTCMTKDNIMKMTDGLFHKIFDEIAAEYPEIENRHMIIDIGTARIASRPQDFDVIVTPNLYGDIISDVAAEVAGSVGLAGSSNIGQHCAMFEAIHGSAPDIAGKNIANPSGMLQSAVLMLVHLGKVASASKIQNAWLRTLEEGIHTADNFREGVSKQKVGTQEFAQAVIARLGQMPEKLATVNYPENDSSTFDETQSKMQSIKRTIAKKCLVGVDVFLNWDASDRNPKVLGKLLEALAGPEFRFSVISNRGVKVYPDGNEQTLCTDHWRCRFLLQNDHPDSRIICTLLMRIAEAGLDAVKTENLYEFDGMRGYSQVQGE